MERINIENIFAPPRQTNKLGKIHAADVIKEDITNKNQLKFNMKLTPEELEKRKENLQKLEASMKLLADMSMSSGGESEGEDGGESEDKMCELEDKCCQLMFGLSYAWEEIRYLSRLIGYLQEDLMSHMDNGHLPAVKSTEQMKRAVSALGLDDEYNVEKRTLWASQRGGQKLVIGR